MTPDRLRSMMRQIVHTSPKKIVPILPGFCYRTARTSMHDVTISEHHYTMRLSVGISRPHGFFSIMVPRRMLWTTGERPHYTMYHKAITTLRRLALMSHGFYWSMARTRTL